jgi:hypothetical protein
MTSAGRRSDNQYSPKGAGSNAMNRHQRRAAQARARNASLDAGFEKYRELFQHAYKIADARDIGEDWMRGEALRADGTAYMILHPTGAPPPAATDDDIRLSASYGPQCFQARTTREWFPTLVAMWPQFLDAIRDLPNSPVTGDPRHDARALIFNVIMSNQWADPQVAAITGGAIAWLASTSPVGRAIGESHWLVHYEITDVGIVEGRKKRNYRLVLGTDEAALDASSAAMNYVPPTA